MLKICFIAPDIGQPGAMTGLSEMVEAYRKNGATVYTISPNTRAYPKGIKTIIFGLIALYRYARLGKKVDVIHTHSANGWINIFLKWAKPIKVVTMHNCYAGELKAYDKMKEARRYYER